MIKSVFKIFVFSNCLAVIAVVASAQVSRSYTRNGRERRGYAVDYGDKRVRYSRDGRPLGYSVRRENGTDIDYAQDDELMGYSRQMDGVTIDHDRDGKSGPPHRSGFPGPGDHEGDMPFDGEGDGPDRGSKYWGFSGPDD